VHIPANFSLLVDEQRAATHNRCCNMCWNRHADHSIPLDGRIRKPTLSLFEQLLAASDELQPPPPQPPPPPPPPPPAPQPTSQPVRSQSSPVPSHGSSTIHGSSSTPLNHAVQRTISIANAAFIRASSSVLMASPSKQLTPRRKWALKDKQQICDEWETAQTSHEKQAVKRKWRAEQLDGHHVQRWQEMLSRNEGSPRGVKAAKHEARLRGAGRTPQLTEEQETELDNWVMDKRRQLLQVRVCDIQTKARALFKHTADGTPFIAGSKWVAGFMERQRLSLRLATTNKHVTTTPMRLTQFHFRNKLAVTYPFIDPLLMYNMDETSVTLDQPGMRTVDRKGAKCVPIGTTGHHCDRVAVVICVSRGGNMVTPLVIRSGGKTSRYNGVFFEETHGGMKMYVTESGKAWLNSAGMVKWLHTVHLPYVRNAQLQKLQDTLLFMDNCSVHDGEQCTATLNEQKIPHQFFPPHCTPILQPCDQNVNHIFKMEYERQWREWMEETGCRDDNVTRYGNPAAANKPTYMAWIGKALCCIDAKVINDSWRMSCSGYGFIVIHLPSTVWLRIMDFLPRKTVLVTPCTQEEAAWELVHTSLQHYRKLYNGWRDYQFPVKKRRQKAAVGVNTTSAPCKRRRPATVVSDDDVEIETDVGDDDKENQPPTADTATRDELREERYQHLQREERDRGSTRVLDKRATSALWATWQPMQPLENGAVPR
jgi:hypothetical protein